MNNSLYTLISVILIFTFSTCIGQQVDSVSSHKVDTSIYVQGDNDFNLIIASELGYAGEVKRLLKLGADPNTKTWEGVTPLMYASEKGHLEIVKILIDTGANINYVPDDGVGALIAASIFNELDVVETLIRAGADVEAKDSQGRTALIHAVANDFYMLTDMLLYYDANVNHKDADGNTPALIACYNGNYEMVKLLDNYNADFDISDKHGYTPLMIASQKGFLKIVEYLTEFNPLRVEEQTKSGETPLALAIVNNKTEVTKYLLEQGADPNRYLKKSENTLSIAQKYSNDTIRKVLKNYGAKPDYRPDFYKIGFGTDLNLNFTDFMMDFFFSLEDSKYNSGIFLGYGFRPWKNRVLADNPYDGKTYQVWEKRRNIYFGINKKFIFSESYNERRGIGAFANFAYTFGNYSGTIFKPESRIIVAPRITFFHDLYFNRFETGLEYLPLNAEGINNLRVVFAYTLNINFKSKVVKSKQINWLNN